MTTSKKRAAIIALAVMVPLMAAPIVQAAAHPATMIQVPTGEKNARPGAAARHELQLERMQAVTQTREHELATPAPTSDTLPSFPAH